MTIADSTALIIAAGIPLNALTGLIVAWNAIRMSRLESRVESIAVATDSRIIKPIRRDFGYLPIIFVLITLSVMLMLLTGCVQTRFTHGETSMTRTALFTGIKMPSFEIGTNGTMKASLDSTPRTELLSAILKLLLTAAPP